MKTQIAMTWITKSAHLRRVYRAGYCELQTILAGVEPRYYNAGVYGWNCDIYINGDVAITTGYRNTRGDPLPEGLVEKYNRLIEDTRERLGWCSEFYDARRELVDQFWRELAA